MSSPRSRSSSPRRSRSSSSSRPPPPPIFLTRQPNAPLVVPDLPPEELEELDVPPEVPYFMVRPHTRAPSPSRSPRSRSRGRPRSPSTHSPSPVAHGGPAVPPIPPIPLIAVPASMRQRHSVRPPRSPIPLPFVTLDGTDMGDRPIDYGVLGIFQSRGFRAGDLRDVSSEIDDYVFGNDFRTVVAPMTEAQKSQFRVTCWVRFQDTLLVPAVNRMIPATETPILQLTPPQRAYVRAQHSKLSPLQFFAGNLYTKDSPGTSFFHALNRILLQVDAARQDIRLNALPYDDDKKIFNVWFYLFLSGIHKLIVPVPANFRNYPRSHPTVRLYRGLGVGENLSTVLWQPPEISGSLDESHKLHTHMSLGFSSFTTSVDIACRFSVPRVATMHPHIVIFEPRRGRIALPSLRLVSDTAVEDEFLMFPNYSVMIFSREERVLESRALGETCDWSRVLAGDAAVAAAQGIDFTPVLESMPKRITWIGITDLTGATTLQEDIQGSRSESGGGRSRRRRRMVAKCKKTCKGRRLARKTKRRRSLRRN
jgi:hypothetical protein